MQESVVFLVRVQCRRKESSRSLSHLLMSFLFTIIFTAATLPKTYVSYVIAKDSDNDKVNLTSQKLCVDCVLTRGHTSRLLHIDF